MILNIINRININNKWQKVDLKNLNNCYLIAIKDNKQKIDTIDPEGIKKIRFEIGIDCGIKGKEPLTVQYINLNFDDMTSGDNEVNKRTAFTRLTSIPSQFYIKVTSVDDGLKEIKQGQTSISININALDLK